MSLRVGGGRRAGTGGVGSWQIWECVSNSGQQCPLTPAGTHLGGSCGEDTPTTKCFLVNQERLQDVLMFRFCVSLVLSLWPHTDGVGDVGILKV